jgi:hypothetical protein
MFVIIPLFKEKLNYTFNTGQNALEPDYCHLFSCKGLLPLYLLPEKVLNRNRLNIFNR